MKQSKSKEVILNLFWRFLERTGAQGVVFIVSIILARLLNPEIYGTVAIVTVIMSILQVFIDSGLGNSLIQKKDADDLDFSTVFYFNLVICSVLYVTLFTAAPFITQFYNMPALTPLIRVSGLTLIVSGIKNIQQAYVSRNMMFKKFFFATLGGTIGSAVLGVFMAYRGYGAWALVFQSLFNNIVDTIILWVLVKWRPRLQFSFLRLKGLFGFGWKLLFTTLLETAYDDLGQLIIGRKYSSSQLAYYNKGKQFPNYIVTNINSSIKSVMFPVFSKEQDDISRLKYMTKKSIQVSNYLISPMIIGLAACAETFVSLVLTEKWLPCVVYLRLFSISYLFQPIQTTNKNVIKALGKGEILLKVQLIIRVLGILLIAATMNFGILTMTISVILTSILEQYVLARQNKKLLHYGYFEQIGDMMPALILSMVMGIVVYMIHFINLSLGYLLGIQILTGSAIYLLASIVTKNDTFIYLISFIFIKKEDIIRKS